METVVEYRLEERQALEAEVLAALEAGAAQVVLDLDNIETLDTQALRGLISLLRRARAAGGELVEAKGLEAGACSAGGGSEAGRTCADHDDVVQTTHALTNLCSVQKCKWVDVGRLYT